MHWISCPASRNKQSPPGCDLSVVQTQCKPCQPREQLQSCHCSPTGPGSARTGLIPRKSPGAEPSPCDPKAPERGKRCGGHVIGAGTEARTDSGLLEVFQLISVGWGSPGALMERVCWTLSPWPPRVIPSYWARQYFNPRVLLKRNNSIYSS